MAGELSACPFNGFVCKAFNRLIWQRDEEPAAFFQFDREWCWLNFNDPLSPADLQLAARL